MSEASKLRMVFQTEGDAAAIANTRAVGRAVDDVADSGGRAGSRLGTMFSVAGGFLGAMAVTKVLEFGKGILFADAQAEQLKMSLETVVGDRAQGIYDNLQAFAAKTPFSFPELVESTVNLEAFGINSQKWMPIIGDTAAAMGKSVDQVTQAVLDASSGQYERLKELGIQARIEGDKLVFSYMKNGRMITETVDKNNKEQIESTIGAIWNGKYAGAMEKQSKTFLGQWSTLKDNISLRLQEMSGGVFGFVTSAVGFFNDIFANGFRATISDRFGPGAAEFIGHLGTMAKGVVEAFGEGTPVADIVAKLPESWQGIGDAVLTAADAFGQLWTDVGQHDWRGVANDLRQLGQAGFMLVGALGQSLIPKIQQFLDSNRLSGFTAAIRIDAFDPVFDAAARGDIEQALTQIFEVDPIKITPKIELNIREAIANAIGGVGGIGGGGGGGDKFGIKDTIQGILDNIGIGGIISKWIGEKIGPDALRAGRAIVEGIAEGLVIRAASTDWVGLLLTSGQSTINGFWEGAQQIWTIVEFWLLGRGQAALGKVGDLSATLKETGQALIQGMWSGAEDIWVGFTTWCENIGGEILTYVGDLSGLLTGVGNDIINGLAAGIRGAAGAVDDAVGSIVSRIPSFVRGLLDSNSPSRVMRDVGVSIPQGLALGIDTDAHLVTSSMRRLVGIPTVGAVPTVRGSVIGAGANAGHTYIITGSIVGGDIDRYITDRVASGQARRIDKSISRSRLAESF